MKRGAWMARPGVEDPAPERWTVEPWRDDVTGKCAARCPLCTVVVETATEHGVMEALCRHMNADHYRPPRGNA